ncbi:hypothetical protein ABQ137_02965 [Xanthomonas sp. WHRI 8393]|uniref:hypothetical protein n=1 Tax=Xanthomonas sp. WHRI 8393 TaxID=3161574 RepID=UPI0032E90D76
MASRPSVERDLIYNMVRLLSWMTAMGRGLACRRIEIRCAINVRGLGGAVTAPWGGIGAVRGTLGQRSGDRPRASRKAKRDA